MNLLHLINVLEITDDYFLPRRQEPVSLFTDIFSIPDGLTEEQERVIDDILHELESNELRNRDRNIERQIQTNEAEYRRTIEQRDSRRLVNWIKRKVAGTLAYICIPVFAILPYRPTFSRIQMLPYDHTKLLIGLILFVWSFIWLIALPYGIYLLYTLFGNMTTAEVVKQFL